jgi:hypothetical protein
VSQQSSHFWFARGATSTAAAILVVILADPQRAAIALAILREIIK